MFPLTASKIATLIRCPESNVASNWPLVETCLDALKIGSDNVCIAALATIAVETAHTFKPIHEYGTRDYFIAHYDNRADLGNTHPGDGYKFAGRGYIQITGEINYEHYGRLLAIDLIANPDEALDPNCAAAILAAYFHSRGVDLAAEQNDWSRARKLVNGGLNGYADSLSCVHSLTAAVYEPTVKDPEITT
ncbi:MAG: glycoside hydrolase family 19 protein [Terriglobales bacterium]